MSLDRLNKIKGYADRSAQKDDLRWLIGEVERLTTALAVAELDAQNAWRMSNGFQAEVARLKGEATAPPCPCRMPDDHAGWCPHR